MSSHSVVHTDTRVGLDLEIRMWLIQENKAPSLGAGLTALTQMDASRDPFG